MFSSRSVFSLHFCHSGVILVIKVDNFTRLEKANLNLQITNNNRHGFIKSVQASFKEIMIKLLCGHDIFRG